MNYQRIMNALSTILILIGGAMFLPFLWAIYYGEADATAFLLVSSLTLLIGIFGYKNTKRQGIFQIKEVFLVVTLGWLLASCFGALPYLLSGTLSAFADAFFETMSGFTTTGATVFIDLEVLPHGILFWRCLTQWLGGMGIVVLFISLLSSLGAGGMQMFRAESPGASMLEKVKPRISEWAKTLWYIYLLLTVTETLLLVIFGMSFFDALCHTFSTVATGGFSTKNASIGFYQSAVIEWIIILFMFLSGANFALHYQAFHIKSLRGYTQNSEFKLYVFWIFATTFLLTLNFAPDSLSALGETVRQSLFQVVSLMTSTGYVTSDFDLWSLFAKALLVILMLIGGCAGSTSGAMKMGRVLVLLKQTKLELQRCLHPRAVFSLKIDGRNLEQEKVISILQFFFLYIGMILFSTVFMSFLGLDAVTALTSSVASIGNIGPGLNLIGPTQNFAFLPALGKYYLAFLMLLGRLEIYTLLVLFLPSFWRKG